MQFSYTVINREGKKLTGTIDADNETLAREELNKLGFPVINMTAVTDETAEEILGKTTKFEFEAIDQNGRKIIGTISGEDRYEAFRRLIIEYHFTVESIWRAAASLEKKEEEKELGAVDLYTRLKKETSEKKKETQSIVLEKEQEEKEKFIQQKVDEIFEKEKNLLDTYGQEIKDEEKNTIRQKADRLIRLKTSSNINYVRHLAEELLRAMENASANLDAEKIKLDIKKLLSEIHEKKLKPTLRQDILKRIKEWKEKNVEDVGKTKFWVRTQNNVYTFISDILTELPEISTRKGKIALLSKQIFSYYKLLLKEKSPQLREEMKESIKSMRQEKAKLQEEIKEIRKKYREEELLKQEESALQKMTRELLALLGWILFFYFLAFILSFYQKTVLGFSATNDFIVLLFILLLIYLGGTAKKIFLQSSRLGTLIIGVLVIASSSLIMLNFR